MALKLKQFPTPLVIFGSNGAAVITEGTIFRNPSTGEPMVGFSITDRVTGERRIAAIPASRVVKLNELEAEDDAWDEIFGEEPQEES